MLLELIKYPNIIIQFFIPLYVYCKLIQTIDNSLQKVIFTYRNAGDHKFHKSILYVVQSRQYTMDYQVDSMSDDELRQKLTEHGFPVMPITPATRKLLEKKLKECEKAKVIESPKVPTSKSPNKSIRLPAETVKEKSSGSGFLWLLLYSAVALLLAYAAASYLTKTPDMPQPDPNQYWGTYPMDSKPDTTITQFTIEFPDEIVNDLKDRLLHYRKPPPPLENTGFKYGFNSVFLTQVVDYWRNRYNFKERESFLNQYRHYKTKIQGLNIHFMRVVPENVDEFEVVPLLLLHGWPGSFREFYEMIPILTKPRAGKNFVFEVIVPSLPGFGYSQSASRPGLGPMEMAVIMNNLMQRIGHKNYYVQGGDLGHSVGSIMATLYPDHVLGFHTNFPALLFSPLAHLWIYLGSIWPSIVESSELQDRLYPLRDKFSFNVEETGYMHVQATKPDTVGSALTDSPAGLAAYILEKFSTWSNPGYRQAYDGNLLKKFSLTHLLDNVMVYWATNSVTTSMRIYAETFSTTSYSMVFDRIPTSVPTCGIKFKHELVHHPDQILKMKYKNYLQSTVVEDGGHFAAMENPELLAADIYNAVSLFRKFHGQRNSTTTPETVYDYTVKDIHGNTIKLDKYKGYVLLIVNVASQCGLTETNYKELNQLHDKYYSRGLRILAFPCNQFNGQEPGSPKDILEFTKQKGVSFDLFDKVDVNGDNADPLWKFLKKAKGGTMGDFIKWNFSKFVVDRSGVPVARLGPNVNPLDLEPYILEHL